jgi:hypothetical protein
MPEAAAAGVPGTTTPIVSAAADIAINMTRRSSVTM